MDRYMKRAASVLMTVLVGATLSGCAAQTRLGALIPAHVKSEQISGEMITAHFLRLPEKKKEAPEGDKAINTFLIPAAAPAAGAILGFVADMAANAVRNALAKEADRYEHSYAARLLLTTKDLEPGGVIVVIRWVDSPGSTVGTKPTGKDLVPEINEQVWQLAITDTLGPKIEELMRLIPGKTPAAVLTLRVDHGSVDAPIYRLSGAKLYLDSVGAKVVDYGWRNLPKVWELLGAAAFKTDSQATYMPTMKVKAVVATKEDSKGNVTAAEWTSIEPESPVMSTRTNVDLDELPRMFRLGTSTGSWLYAPTITDPVEGKVSKERHGFLVMDFAFTESDASNARKYALQGVNYIDENKENWKNQAKALGSGLLGGGQN